MATLTLRNVKGSALTYAEMDNNLTALNTEVEAATAAIADIDSVFGSVPKMIGRQALWVNVSSGSSAPTVTGGGLTGVGSISGPIAVGSTNTWSNILRKQYQTAASAGSGSGIRQAYGQWFRGSATGYGGFLFRATLGMQINLNGGRKFCGLAATTGPLAGDPSALVNMIGMGYDAADLSSGNWQFMMNDGSGTAMRVDLGASAARNTTDGYDLTMYLAPGGSEVFVRIVNLTTAAVVLDTSYTTDLPATNTALALHCEAHNGAIAAADNIQFGTIWIGTEY